MKKTLFISDLHLGATYDSRSADRERRVCAFLESVAPEVDRIYFMGDILDYWFEYRTVVPRGYIRFFGTLAKLADSGVKITWYIGNHDIWLFDYLRNEIGIEIVDGWRIEDIAGTKFFLSHGDGVGSLPRSFKILRGFFRNRVCQKLYAAIHPRWTVGFAHRWSASSRRKENATPPFLGEDEPLVKFAREEALRHPEIRYFVFGHRHLAVDAPLTPTSRFVILGDWLTNDTYGIFDGSQFKLVSLNGTPIIDKI